MRSIPALPILPTVTALTLSFLFGACGSSTSPEAQSGTIDVTVQTSGNDIDADGFVLVLDGAATGAIDASGRATLTVPAGSHALALSGLAANCSVDGAADVVVEVGAGSTIPVAFAVACPAESTLNLVLRVAGDMPDPDGFTYSVAGLTGRVSAGESAKLSPIPSGTYDVLLDDVEPNCHQTADQVPVDVQPASTAVQKLTVFCLSPDAGWIAFLVREPPYFEIWRMEATGAGTDRIRSGGQAFEPAISPDGKQIAFENGGIFVMNSDGTNVRRLTSTGNFPSWSPDGGKIAYAATGPSGDDRIQDIFVMDPDGGNPVDLTLDASTSQTDPAWSPDGTRIVYVSYVPGSMRSLFLMDSDGGNQNAVTGRMYQTSDPDWSPDGTTILFSAALDADLTTWSVFRVGADGTDLERVTSSVGDYADYGAFSPDGRWIVFASTRGGTRTDIFVMRLDGSDLVRLKRMSLRWADSPTWARR